MRELNFVFPLLVGLLFLLGRGIVFGFEGVEPTVLHFPQSEVVGWFFIGLSILWAFPPWIVARITKIAMRVIKNIIGYFKEEKGLLKQ